MSHISVMFQTIITSHISKCSHVLLLLELRGGNSAVLCLAILKTAGLNANCLTGPHHDLVGRWGGRRTWISACAPKAFVQMNKTKGTYQWSIRQTFFNIHVYGYECSAGEGHSCHNAVFSNEIFLVKVLLPFPSQTWKCEA